MSEKISLYKYDLIFDWLRFHFLPRKSIETIALILDDSFHCNSIEMLKFAQSEDILLICLPRRDHTHYLQLLDRAVFKSVKKNFFDAASK